MEAWRDPKKYAWPLALLVPALPFTGYAGWRGSGGAGWAWWIAPVVVFGVIPAVDVLLGDDGANPPDDATPRLQQMRYYRWLTYLYLPAQYAALVLCCAVWVRGGLGVVGGVGLVLTVGIVNGIAINTAHELGHKREAVERWLSRIALAATGYGHFRIVTNVFLFQLQRHSDHHANPLRRYQTLRSFAESPQLPGGYASMILLALLTPLWRRVMDPRVVAHYGGDLSLANLHPPAAARLHRRYQVSAASSSA